MLSALAVADYGVTKYDIGNGLNHFGLAVPNVSAWNPRIPNSEDASIIYCINGARIELGS
jgi:hypothetical protein